ncbi:hypothetical protein CLU79DRAFT_749430, partial [Phycomyces nitens]
MIVFYLGSRLILIFLVLQTKFESSLQSTPRPFYLFTILAFWLFLFLFLFQILKPL